MSGIDSLLDLPLPAQIVLGVLVICQLALIVWALVRLVGDNRERVLGLPRWAWGLIIVLGQFVGSIVFLVLHIREQRDLAEQRRYQEQYQGESANERPKTSSVINDLYKD